MRAQSRSKNLISQVVQPTLGLVPKFKCQEIRDRTLCQCCSQSGIRDVVELTIKSYSDISGQLACQCEERRTVCKRVGCVSRRGNRIVHRRGKRCVVCRPIPVTHAIVKFLHPEENSVLTVLCLQCARLPVHREVSGDLLSNSTSEAATCIRGTRRIQLRH